MAVERAAENVAVVEEVLRRLVDRDVAGALDLYTADVVYEFPYAVPPMAARQEGKAAVERFLTGLMVATRRIALEDVRVEPLATQDRVVAQFRGDWDLANGRPYRNTYIAMIELREGRVCHWLEYFNPLVAQEAFAPKNQ